MATSPSRRLSPKPLWTAPEPRSTTSTKRPPSRGAPCAGSGVRAGDLLPGKDGVRRAARGREPRAMRARQRRRRQKAAAMTAQRRSGSQACPARSGSPRRGWPGGAAGARAEDGPAAVRRACLGGSSPRRCLLTPNFRRGLLGCAAARCPCRRATATNLHAFRFHPPLCSTRPRASLLRHLAHTRRCTGNLAGCRSLFGSFPSRAHRLFDETPV